MTSSIAVSRIDRRPRAPVLRLRASLTTARSAPSVNLSSTVSKSNSFLNCLTMAFLGSVKIRIRAASSSWPKEQTIGTRPMNSGIMPNFIKSSVWTLDSKAPTSFCSLERISAPKPIEATSMRPWMMSSSPAKAPPQMNRMLVVSTCRNSCCGCLRPPRGGTLAMVPSMILRRACCTPSPETSRVIDGFSPLRAILSISST